MTAAGRPFIVMVVGQPRSTDRITSEKLLRAYFAGVMSIGATMDPALRGVKNYLTHQGPEANGPTACRGPRQRSGRRP
jgi:hypothetical protein